MNFPDALDDKAGAPLTNIELKVSLESRHRIHICSKSASYRIIPFALVGQEKAEEDSREYFYAIYSNPLTQGLEDRAYEASVPGHLMNETKDESPIPTIIASTDLRVESEPSGATIALDTVSNSEQGGIEDDTSCPSSPTAKDPLNIQKERSEGQAILSQINVQNCQVSAESR